MDESVQPLLKRVKNKLLYSFFRQKWNIAAVRQPVSLVAGLEGAQKQQQALQDLVWMREEVGAFYADPFVMHLSESREFRIFYEHLDWKSGRGRIDTVSLDANGAFSQPRIALETDFHLSYPFVFDWNGRAGFIPEHSEARDFSFYIVDGNGRAVEKTTIAADFPVVDGTIVFWEGRYWLFATSAGETDKSHLQIFFASDPLGPWCPHPANPVKIDRANARPAGQFIVYRGKLFRPAQNCAEHYGAAININEINCLTDRDFSESVVSEVRAADDSPYNFGLHTLSHADGITVIDGARLQSKLHPGLDGLSRFVL